MQYEMENNTYEYDLRRSLSYEIIDANSYSSFPKLCFIGQYGLMHNYSTPYYGKDIRIDQRTG